jgi:hypothetical protein
MKKVLTARHVRYGFTVLAAIASLTPSYSHAQRDPSSDFNSAAESGYGDKFREAEEALMAGLSRGDDSKPSLVHPASLSASPAAPAESGPTIIRKKGPTPVIQEQPSEPEVKTVEPASMAPRTAEEAPQKSNGAVAVLQKRLSASELRVKQLEQQLIEAKSQLSAAEVEINRLSAITGSSSRARLAPRAVSQGEDRTVRTPPAVTRDVAPPAPSNDMQIATIAVDKADLRLGPGKNNSALMTLPRGSRLAVEARSGDWYRVFAPNGQRAWIHSSLVRFGQGAASLNDGSSVTVRGFDAAVGEGAYGRGK